MYKTKITQWDLRKYCKGKGMTEASVPAQQCVNNVASIEKSNQKISSDARFNPRFTQNPNSSHGGLPKLVLSPTRIDDRVELVLRCVADYSDSRLEDRASLPGELTNSSRAWTEQMVKSIALLSLSASHRARETLEVACATAYQAMAQPQHDLLQNILVVFLRGWWLTFPGLRPYLICYLMKLAAHRLKCRHPLTIVLFQLMDEEVMDQAAESAMQMAITAAEKERPFLDRRTWTPRHSFCCLLFGRRQYRAAEVRIVRLLNDSVVSYGVAHPLTRSVVLRQGDLYFYLGEWGEAQRYYQDAIQLANQRYGNPFPDPVGFEAYARLAEVHLEQGNLLIAQELCTAALTDPWTPLSNTFSSRNMVSLKVMLQETLLMVVHAQQKLADSAETYHDGMYEDFDSCNSYDISSRSPRDQAADSGFRFTRHVVVIRNPSRLSMGIT